MWTRDGRTGFRPNSGNSNQNLGTVGIKIIRAIARQTRRSLLVPFTWRPHLSCYGTRDICKAPFGRDHIVGIKHIMRLWLDVPNEKYCIPGP